MSYTKGEWKYKRTHLCSGDAWYVIVDSNGRGPITEVGGKDKNGQIAEMKYLVTDPEVIEANARRICQCVNNFDGLLEACKEAISLLWTKPSTASKLLEQAIAKAEKGE